MEHEIDWNEECECYVWWRDGAGMTLEASTADEAQEEVKSYVAQGIFPGEVSDDLLGISHEDWATLDVETHDDDVHAPGFATAGHDFDDHGCFELNFD